MTSVKICATCGTHYPPGASFDVCPICDDPRQYLPEGGQIWTTPAALWDSHSVKSHQLHDHIFELEIAPAFAIGQRAFLLLSKQGNILWDCIPLLDDPIKAFIRAHGGLRAIAFSHPHYYSNMNDWADAFDCPVYIHRSDEPWIFNRGPHIELWEGDEKQLWDGMRLINLGGHFPGSSILHVPFLSPGGTVFCGDTMVISPSKKHIAVQYSYPNRMPLPRKEVERISARLETISFDTLYSFYKHLTITNNVREILKRSMERYLA
ncbi:MAG: MBL fold metallo-hydrolase [Bacteroidota bacterium]